MALLIRNPIITASRQPGRCVMVGGDLERVTALLDSSLNFHQDITVPSVSVSVYLRPDQLVNVVTHPPPQELTIFRVPSEMIDSADVLAALKHHHAKGMRFYFDGLPPLSALASKSRLFEFAVISFDQAATLKAAEIGAADRIIPLVVGDVQSWEDKQICTEKGLSVMCRHIQSRRAPSYDGRIFPEQLRLLETMQLVNDSAPHSQVEESLKRDPSLVLRLLRFMNSASFAGRGPITNLRQALSILGYQPLYRWLSVLLATNAKGTHSPLLIRTSLVRARLLEALVVEEAEKQDLFLLGMFSGLALLMGMPEDVLAKTIPMNSHVRSALVSGEGPYSSWLTLARAVETPSIDASTAIASLGVDEQMIDRAHLLAVAWAEGVQKMLAS